MSPPGRHAPPPGYTVRPPRRDDAEAVAALKRTIDLTRHGESDSTVADVLEEWSLPRLDPLHDLWLVSAADGAAAAYGFVYQERPPDMFVTGHSIHPGHEGRGLEEFLLDVAETRCAATAAGHAPAAATVNAFAHESEDLRLALFERRGYEHVRSFARLQAPLDEAPPAPVWPEGIVVRTFRRDRDEAAVHAAVQEAFLDHWHPELMDLDDWKTLRFGRPDLDLGLWWVAWDGDEVAGGLLASPTPLGGYIDELAVRRGWRGRGLGRALLLQSFAELRGRGLPVAYLGVDTLNPTGAMQLYGSVGMRPVRGAHLVYEKTLAVG